MGVSFKANMKRIAFLLVAAVPALGQPRETVVGLDLILAQNEVDFYSTSQNLVLDIYLWTASFGRCDAALRLNPEFKAVVC